LAIIVLLPILVYLSKQQIKEDFIASVKDRQKVGTSENDVGSNPKSTWKYNGMNYESCYNTETKLGNNVPRTNGYYCDNGIDGSEFIPAEGLYNLDLSNYNVHYDKRLNGKKLIGTYTGNGLTYNLDNSGSPLSKNITLDEAKRFCDGLTAKCKGFIFVVKNRKNIYGNAEFIEDINEDVIDPDAYVKREEKTQNVGYAISFVKKDPSKNNTQTADDSKIMATSSKYKNQTTCRWQDPTKCIFKDYKFDSNGTCIHPTDNVPYSVPGLNRYSQGQFTNWLTELYNRDLGKDKSKSEAPNVYEYIQRCKDVPGYEFLRNLNLNDPYPEMKTKGDVRGRYIKIALANDNDNWLQLAEVSVLSNGVNLAQGKNSSASSVGFWGWWATANRANDGNSDGNYWNGSVFHSGSQDVPQFWEVDLGDTQLLDRIIVANRTDGFGYRLHDWLLAVYDYNKNLVWARIYKSPPNPKQIIDMYMKDNDMKNPNVKLFDSNKFNKQYKPVPNQPGRYVSRTGWTSHCAEQCHIDIAKEAGKKWIGNYNWYACEDYKENETKFQFVPVYSKGSFGNLDRGKEIVDNLFAQNKIFMRECTDCYPSHRVVYYKRISHNNNFSMYENIINTWSSSNNVLNVDFKLYSSYEDLLNDRNPWNFCNYNDPGIGFPRDCGPYGHVPWQWNSSNRGGQPNIKYSVLADPNSIPKESACQKHTRENTCNKRFPWWFSKTCCVGETPVCFNGSYWYPLKEPGSGYTWHTEGWLNPCDGPVRKCLPERCGY
jgi:hypothetical protein